MRAGTIFAKAFITGFSGAAMPGPVLVATLVFAASVGFWAGPLVVTGHFILEILLVAALVAGLSRYLTRPDAPLVRAIGLVGGAVLMLMAYDMLRHLPGLSLATVGRTTTHAGPLQAGLLTSAANPYFWLWWATIGLGLLTESLTRRGAAGVAAFYSGHILSDYTWYALVSGLMAWGGKLLSDPVYRGLMGTCAAALLVFGARFVAVSLRPALVAPAAEQPA